MEDIEILNCIHDTLDSTAFDLISYFIEYAFKTEILWVMITLIFLKIGRTRTMGLVMLIGLITELSTIYITKSITDAPRPFEVFPEVEPLFDDFAFGSFPSSHTALAFLLATVFSTFYKKATIPLFGMAIIVGISRMYAYVHFPIDVAMGTAIGIICGLVAVFCVYRNGTYSVFVEAADQDDDPIS